MPTLLEALYTYAQKNRTAYTLEDGARSEERRVGKECL